MSAFDQWLQKKQKAFIHYKDERDQAFIEQMKTRWIAYKTQPGLLIDNTPKPTQIPTLTDQNNLKFDSSPIQLDKPESVPATPARLITSPPTQPEYVGSPISFSFFGDEIDFIVPQNFGVTLNRSIDDQSISEAWGHLATSDYEIVLDQLQNEITVYQLKDWAQTQLVFQFVNAILSSNRNERIAMSWFLLNRLGMDVRVAHSKSSLFLLLPIKQQVYEVAFLTERGRKYYIFNMGGGVRKIGQLFSYQGDFDQHARSVDVEFEALTWKRPQLKSRSLDFEWNRNQFNLTTEYAGQDILFYRTYPLLGLESYFGSDYRFDYNNGLLVQLHKLINGRSEADALNIVLRFVQSSFQYETDGEQFGKENYLLPTEMLHYRASDCEDRSILFAWLVTELFGYEVVGLKYPGHVATGVAIKGALNGEVVEIKSQKYLIADPTYINANIGMAMKSYRNLKPELL